PCICAIAASFPCPLLSSRYARRPLPERRICRPNRRSKARQRAIISTKSSSLAAQAEAIFGKPTSVLRSRRSTTSNCASATPSRLPRRSSRFRGSGSSPRGGEGSNNVRARGIPTDGFSSVALQENGLSVQYDGGLGYLNADQSFRFDETIERVE